MSLDQIAIQDATPAGPGKSSATNDERNTEGQPTQPLNPSGSGLGFLLDEENDAKVAKHVYRKLWLSQEKASKNRLAFWQVNTARRDGDPYARVKKEGIDEDVVYSFYRPKGSENAPPSLNMTDELCVKVVSQLLVDPPAAECTPASDDDNDRDAAEFSTRVLADILSESGINGTELVREAVDMACSYWSGFVWPYVDPFGGGWRPKEIMASMAATTVDDAVMTMVDGGIDEMGNPLPPQQVPQPEPYEIRYVAEDGKTLTDEPSEASIEWLPRIKACTLTGKNLRFLPDTAKDIRDADGIVICWPVTLGALKAQYDVVAKMSPEDQRKLANFRPERWRDLVPKHVVPDAKESVDGKRDDAPADDSVCFVFFTNYHSTPQYKKGAWVVTVGETFVLHKQPWVHTVERKGKTHEIPMDVCVAQFRQFRDSAGDPLGRGLVDKIGDGDPLLGIAIGALVEYLPKALSPKLLVPVGSGITSKEMSLPRDIPVPYNGSAGTPVFEKIAPFPAEAMELHDRIAERMRSVSGLGETLQLSDTTSGRQAAQVTEQALIAVSGMKRGLDDGFVRMCRIILQLIKLSYTTPQKLKIVGEGGSYKVKEWTASELADTTDVKIAPGTSTMLSASAKQSMATDEFNLIAPLDPQNALEKYRRAVSGRIDPLLGVTDDPTMQEIKRALVRWKDGAPEGWMPVQPPVDEMGQPLMDEMGQPIPPEIDPQNPFVRMPHHLEQDTALVRHKELKRAMATADFGKHPPEWQQLLVAEYEEMRQAAGIQTVGEQRAAAQEAADAEKEGAEAEREESVEEQEAQARGKAEQSQADAEAKHERDMEKERFKATANMQGQAMKMSTGAEA